MYLTLIYASFLALGLIGLSLQVVRLRRRHQVGIGTGTVGALERAVRVQANFCEYVPLAVLLVLMLELAGAHPLLIHGLGVALVVGRALHAIGLAGSAGTSAGRALGTLLTWLVLLVGAIAGLWIGLAQAAG